MIVHRVLDVFFRTLDAVDAVRDRVDQLLGREPRPDPFAAAWPPAEEAGASSTAGPAAAADTAPPAATDDDQPSPRAPKRPSTKEASKPRARSSSTKGSSAKSAAKSETSKAEGAKKTLAATKASRKGSVDRSGKDVDSPRARAVHEHLVAQQLGVVSEDANVQGKKVLARTLWALLSAEAAGSELGLTTADASALLHLAAKMDVFATNIGRACRDHGDLIAESELDGRSRRYRLTDEGRAVAAAIETRPL